VTLGDVDATLAEHEELGRALGQHAAASRQVNQLAFVRAFRARKAACQLVGDFEDFLGDAEQLFGFAGEGEASIRQR
jgi:hypothetical protein